MSVLPKWHNGRVCIPWWYGLGYPIIWCLFGVGIGIRAGENMMDISNASALALIILAVIGSVVYFVFYAVSKYREQRAQAEELKAEIVASGRDPSDASALTVKERWEINKCQKFDKIFLIADILGILVSAGGAIAVIYFYGLAAGRIPDDWQTVGTAAFFGGLIGAWFINETLVKTAAKGEWSKKAAEAFRTVRPIIEDAINQAASRKDELVAKFMAQGFSKKEAEQYAKDVIVDEMKKQA